MYKKYRCYKIHKSLYIVGLSYKIMIGFFSY